MDQSPSTGMPVATPEKSKKGLIIGIVVVLALILGGYFFMKGPSTNPNNVVVGDNNSLAIGDQEIAMLSVFVDSASTKVPAFVVIHEDLNGSAGSIIANSQLLAPGSYEKISFVAKLTEGKTYWAMLHADNGNGSFNATNDTDTLKSNDGKEVLVKFMAKNSATYSGDKG
jgi:uncharacterized protein YxeA